MGPYEKSAAGRRAGPRGSEWRCSDRSGSTGVLPGLRLALIIAAALLASSAAAVLIGIPRPNLSRS
jgi:hypothetical protein